MSVKPDSLTFKQTLKMRHSYFGKSCKLHYDKAPIKLVRASKQYVYDDKGNEYLDCINNTSHVGHCHPHVVGAGQEQMAKLATSYGFLTDSQVEYAKRLVELLPENLCVCYFVNSGSEANDLALRLARSYTENQDVIVVESSYHGNTDCTIKISTSVLKEHKIPVEDWVHIVLCPDVYRGKYRDDCTSPGHIYAEEVKIVVRNALENGRSIAAFMCEPVLTNAGIIVPPEGYLKSVYRYVREAGGVCIADEVQSGLGRCGEKFWAFQYHDVVPDIITLGKPIGNGHPIAVVVTSKEISDSLKEFSSTFGGNPVACAMGMAVLDVIRNEQMLSSAKSVGKCLIDGFRAIMKSHRIMGDVRGVGMIVGVDIVIDKESRKPNKAAAEALVYRLKEKRILTANEGPNKNIIIFMPPLCFTCDNARTVIQDFDLVLKDMEGVTLDSTCMRNENISIPLGLIPASKHIRDSDDDKEEEMNKQQKLNYEDVD